MAPPSIPPRSSKSPTPPSPSTANISIREYIYFTPHPFPPSTPIPYTLGLPANNPLKLPPTCFEPTSTLVLTTPNNTFIDIRLFKPLLPPSTTPLPNRSEPGRLEWGFAGQSSSRKVDGRADGGPIAKRWAGKVSHSVWSHWVDSRVAVGGEVGVDEGDMYSVDEALTLEVGWAFHPHLGRVSGHEEMWRDVGVKAVEGEGKRVCACLRFQDERAGVRGVVVRLGQFCQGIVMKGGNVTVERWEFDGEADERVVGAAKVEVENGGDVVGGWKRTARVGTGFLPCAATFRPGVLGVGAVVRYHEFEWVVEEVWEW